MTTSRTSKTKSGRTDRYAIDLDSRWAMWGNDSFPTDIATHLSATGHFSDNAIATIETLAAELSSRLETTSSRAAVEGFLDATEVWEERCDRWATIGVLERRTPLNVSAQPWPGWAPPDPNLRRRVLTDIEIGLVRTCSRDTIQRAGVIAALDHGAASGELAGLSAAQVAADSAGQAVGLKLAGTGRPVKLGPAQAAPRSVELAAWARPVFTELIADAMTAGQGTRAILYTSGAWESHKVQSKLLMVVGTVFKHAGLAGDPTVKPLSIRNTYGRAVHDANDDIKAAAAALGHKDWMSVAREIGIHPHKPVRKG